MLLGTVENASASATKALRRVELAGADQGGAQLGVGIGVVDDDVDVGVVGDDLTGLGIERGLRRVEDYRSLELAALCRPGRREILGKAFAVGLVAVGDRDQFALAVPSLSIAPLTSARACKLSGGTVRKMVPSSLMVRSRMLVPTGQIVTCLLDGHPIGDGDRFRRDRRSDQTGGPLIYQAARGGEGCLRVALHIGTDVLCLDSNAGLGRLLIGILDRDLDRFVLGGSGLGKRPRHFEKLANREGYGVGPSRDRDNRQARRQSRARHYAAYHVPTSLSEFTPRQHYSLR